MQNLFIKLKRYDFFLNALLILFYIVYNLYLYFLEDL